MKTICKVLKPLTEDGAFYPAGSEIVLEKERAIQMGDLVEVIRDVEEGIKINKEKRKT